MPTSIWRGTLRDGREEREEMEREEGKGKERKEREKKGEDRKREDGKEMEGKTAAPSQISCRRLWRSWQHDG